MNSISKHLQNTSSTITTPQELSKKISAYTLGCRLNQYETDGILSQFQKSGYEIVATDEKPDIIVINTCTVTNQADKKNTQAIRSMQRRNPQCKIVVTGCYAQTDREKLLKEGVFCIIGNDKKSQLFTIVQSLLTKEGATSFFNEQVNISHVSSENNLIASSPIFSKQSDKLKGYAQRPVLEDPFAYGPVLPIGHVRAYLKIQDGCDRRCTYCKIPTARGKGISRHLEDVLCAVQDLDEKRVPEIILTGVNLGWYKDNKTKSSFIHLLEKILDKLTFSRLRLSSIEPCDVDGALAELLQHPKFCQFLHVPLQSGSDKILRSMRRTYNSYSFQKRIEKVLEYNPNILLGTDVMVGFPDEEIEDFEDTLSLCRNLGFAKIHAFRFSPRTGTPAYDYANKNTREIMRARMKQVAQVAQENWENYARRQIENTECAIIEKLEVPDDNFEDKIIFEGLTSNYLRVKGSVFSHNHPLKKADIVPIKFVRSVPATTLEQKNYLEVEMLVALN